jgi:NTF2 fold immunity protein
MNMSNDEVEHNYRPEAGYVPDAETAMRIAEAVWLPLYGAAVLEKRPWRARLENDVWVVEGSLPRVMPGGVPIAKISKRTGEILRVSHGK